jgi:trehalose 6-phosphate phosphatase
MGCKSIDDTTDWALFLDFDGTLVDITAEPGSVAVPGDLSTLLSRLSKGLKSALAVVTGRPIADVDNFLSPLKPIAAGVHGAELRLTAGGEISRLAEQLDPALVSNVLRLGQIDPGVMIEPKGMSIAVHYRSALPAQAAIRKEIERLLATSRDRLEVCAGRKVFEIVPRDISKGMALERILALPTFSGRRPVMIGDDASDQSAFDAALRLGGLALKVAGEHFTQDEADFAGTADVRAWLAALALRLGA